MKKKKRAYEEVNYWESMADSMVGLLLCILLILMLLILYLVRIPDDDYVDLEQGNQYEQYHDADDGGGNHSYGSIDDEYGDEWETEPETEPETGTDWNDDGGGGGGGGYGGDEEDYPFEDPDPGAGEGEGTDKAAVFVQVVDGETGRTIKKSGLEFELYGVNSALQVLNTYYPDKISYKKYETDEAGVFYLPEKINLSSYYLHALSVLAGYDTPENTEFTIEESYDWEDPYVVTVSIYPSKNIIRLQLKDQDNGDPIEGAVFDVIAAENIVTQDGTTRCKAGDIVDSITVDKDGYGESQELYLGNYLLRQTEVPEYYARILTDQAVEVESRTDVGTPAVNEVTEEKTSVKVTVTDALYDTRYIAGAGFTLSTDDGTVVKSIKTDKNGRFTVTDLKKNTTYHIQQISTIFDYQMDTADYSFTVDGEGLINGEKETEFQIKNRIIRISIGIQDRIFQGQVSDVNVALQDASGNVIRVWNSTGLEQTIEGLTPGEYIVVLDGNKDQEQKIVVEDKIELQEYQFQRWTTSDISAVLAAGLLLAGALVLMIFLIKRARHKKAEE